MGSATVSYLEKKRMQDQERRRQDIEIQEKINKLYEYLHDIHMAVQEIPADPSRAEKKEAAITNVGRVLKGMADLGMKHVIL